MAKKNNNEHRTEWTIHEETYLNAGTQQRN